MVDSIHSTVIDAARAEGKVKALEDVHTFLKKWVRDPDNKLFLVQEVDLLSEVNKMLREARMEYAWFETNLKELVEDGTDE